MLSTANITMQFGSKPLFENVSVKFGDGNRYGLIGANGCGKSTFMKILGGDLAPTSGTVMLDKGERLGKLRQDQFAFEDYTVLEVVLMGHAEMWEVMRERDAIYTNPDASEEDYMHAANLEAKFAEMDGYTAEARAGELLGYFLEEIGPVIYNQAVSDVQERLQARVMEVDIELHADEFDYWRKYEQARKRR